MKVTPTAAKGLLLEAKGKLGLDDTQISVAAIYRLAQAMDAYGLALAAAALEALGKDNENRRELLRIPERQRLTDDHMTEALEGDGLKPRRRYR